MAQNSRRVLNDLTNTLGYQDESSFKFCATRAPFEGLKEPPAEKFREAKRRGGSQNHPGRPFRWQAAEERTYQAENHAAFFPGKYVMLEEDAAGSLGYLGGGGGVKVRVKQIRGNDVYVGFMDGKEAWVASQELFPAEDPRASDRAEIFAPYRKVNSYESELSDGQAPAMDIPKAVHLNADEEMCDSFRLVWDAGRDLCELWAFMRIQLDRPLLQVPQSGPPNSAGPWMHFMLSKFGRWGPPGLANALMRPPTTMPPKPPGAEVPMRPCFTFEANDTEAAWQSQLQDFLADGLQLEGCHHDTERVRPWPEDIYRCISAGDRQQSVLWLAKVCTLHGLDDSVLMVCVLLLDRYCASSKERMDLDRAHCTVIAVFSIAVKVIGAAAGGANHPEHLRFMAEHISQDKFSKQDIARAELEVLQALDFDLAGHSPLDFLESFLFSLERPKSHGMPSALVCVSTFLLQLSLGDANILHRYPYAALAAGAIYVGLWCTQASSERCHRLLQDATEALSAPVPQTPDPAASHLVLGGDGFTASGYLLSEV